MKPPRVPTAWAIQSGLFRSRLRLPLLVCVLLAGSACSDSTGTNVVRSGGTVAGGTPSGGGVIHTGGTPSGGGVIHTGGTATTGGASALGGSSGSGGAPTGGVPATGGTQPDAGIPPKADAALSTGGIVSTGGSPWAGGSSPTGGTPRTGGIRADAGADVRTGGLPSTGGSAADAGVVACTLPPASSFQLNTSVGGGGSSYKESDHFVVFGSTAPDTALNLLEAAHQCFVEEWCWRSTGLSITSSSGVYNKFNAYAVASLSGNAAGVMQYDSRAGLAYLQVLPQYMSVANVLVHEYGHALTLAAKSWVDQTRTGFWWEAMANFVADTFLTSTICANARTEHGIAQGNSLIDLATTIGNSHWTLCMNQNYYQAWPFFSYLTFNPDGYAGIGKQAIPDLWRTYKGNNETPLHTLERMIAPMTVQALVGRYWARMAYVDIGHPQAQKAFQSGRSRLNYANLSAAGTGTYQVLAARQPRYFGANIIPLKLAGTEVSAQVTIVGGSASSGMTATLAIRSTGGTVRYVDLPDGAGQATLAAGEEASLVVVNTPKVLILYDPSTIGATVSTDPANVGLDYQVKLSGATPAN